MESPLAAIETNRNIEQETQRAVAGDKDQDQVVRELLAEVAELRIEDIASEKATLQAIEN